MQAYTKVKVKEGDEITVNVQNFETYSFEINGINLGEAFKLKGDLVVWID